MHELARQAFIPLWGRLFTLLTFVGGITGFFLTRNPLRYLLATIILGSALIATSIGLGVDARMRTPIEPYMFILFGTTCAWLPHGMRSLLVALRARLGTMH
jgi:hypothetical protein